MHIDTCLRRAALLVAVFSILASSWAHAQASQPTGDIVITDYLVLEPVGKAARMPVLPDALVARIVAGDVIAPRAGDLVTLPDGSSKAWQSAAAKPDGALEHDALRGGYAFATIPCAQARTMLLDARGHGVVYVNGEIRAGNPYGFDYMQVPVALREGTNTFLFHAGRGSLSARLHPLEPHPVISASDHTLPDLVALAQAGEPAGFDVWAAAPVINPLDVAVDVSIRAEGQGLKAAPATVVRVPAQSVRKAPFRICGLAPDKPATLEITLTLEQRGDAGGRDVDTQPIQVACLGPSEVYRRTFVSDIDGSVQYYAVNPPARVPGPADGGEIPAEPPALFLSLHGASVEAIGQARAYSRKNWGYIVAPTNRRPFGFDWEEWGRIDALEVLDLAARQLRTDPRRVYVTGHSMGGHGTWHLGVTFPDRFAAIGPSAGWVSFFSYAGAERPKPANAIQELLARASNPSDTLALLENSRSQGIYILHGDADDNVPVSEARTLREALATFHRDVDWHEQPGAGHWWESSDELGAECVDWPPMFDKFARRRLPSAQEVRRVDFSTFNPGVSSRCFWASIEAQAEMLRLSRIQLQCDPLSRRIHGVTSNVRRLKLDLAYLSETGSITIVLDEQSTTSERMPADHQLWLERVNDRWTLGTAPPNSDKNPRRCGPFKEAFQHRFVLVYGTTGTDEENAWALHKARFDAETFWYRGNGSPELIADRDFDPAAEPDRGVILYGNSQSNGAWKALLADSPVQVRRDRVTIGTHILNGADLACLFVRPRPGSQHACVAVVSGTGAIGLRCTERLPYFLSGVAYPDCTVISADVLSRGTAGVRAAGFFGLDWSVDRGEFAFSD